MDYVEEGSDFDHLDVTENHKDVNWLQTLIWYLYYVKFIIDI